MRTDSTEVLVLEKETHSIIICFYKKEYLQKNASYNAANDLRDEYKSLRNIYLVNQVTIYVFFKSVS